MKINKLTILSAAVLSASLVASCGGGGGSGTDTSNPTTARSGTISGFGSVFINGIEYQTNGTVITIDGAAASESDLKVGMVVRVAGSDDGRTGRAHSIDNSDELEGLVISNSVDATSQTGSMDIMGQTVNIKATTIFESYVNGVTRPSDIAPGNIVEVNGYSDNNGNVYATRLEVKAADLATYLVAHPQGIEVKGIVGPVDSMLMTFPLGGITVNYTAAIIDINGGLQEGQYVEVKSTAGLNNNGELVASKIELENHGEMGHHGDEDDEFEIKGVITADYANGMFMIDGTTVIVTPHTEMEHISTSQLVVGTLVEVEGYFNADGHLVADEIEREDEADTEVKGVIQSIVVDGTNAGTITLMNSMVVIVTPETMMVDERDEHMTPVHMFNITHLANGDYIEVHGHMVNGNLIAHKLKRDDASH